MAFIMVDSLLTKPDFGDFLKLLCSLVGPNGQLCLISSPVDSLTLTSTSSRVTSNISPSNPILQFVLQCMKSQTERFSDGGLYCGILLSKLLLHTVEHSYSNPVCSILVELRQIIQDEFKSSSKLSMAVDLNSVKPFMTIAKSVLFSKYGIFEGKDAISMAHANAQVSLLVRAFFQSEASIGKVLLTVRDKPEQQCLLNGLLYQCTNEEHIVLKGKAWHSVSLLLFSVMLSDTMDCKEKKIFGVDYSDKCKAQLESAKVFIEKAFSCGINVIACQKVVHPMLLLKWRRKGILVLHRLGKQMAQALETLSGAIPISSLEISQLDFIVKLRGLIKSVQQLDSFEENFVLLEGASDSQVCSLSLSSRSFECGAELKIVAHQVLSALSQVLHDAAVYPGGGCTEVHLCWILSVKVQERRKNICEKLNCSVFQVEAAMRWLQEGLLLASGLKLPAGKVATDSIYHHAWKGSDDKNSIVKVPYCNCGLISSKIVRQLKGSWSLLSMEHPGVLNSNFYDQDMSTLPPPTLPGYSSVLDVCSAKESALLMALDNAIAITNIGAMIVRL